jgi:MFS family permease
MVGPSPTMTGFCMSSGDSQSQQNTAPQRSNSKPTSITLLVLAEIAGMSLWFASAAILPDMVRESAIGAARQAMLSSGVQLGFVAGALVVAASGLADRFDPRRVFALSAVLAALCNAALLAAPIGGNTAILLRFLTGLLLAGVYPVGMKIAVGWGTRDRGLLVGLLVGALTVGSALPHLAAYLGGADWRSVIVATSVLAFLGGLLVLLCGLGPHHARAPRFSTRAIALAWTNRQIRLTYLGYFGHMWELYAMWAWVGVAAAASYGALLGEAEATRLAKLTAFLAIALGGLTCAPAGWVADRIGKAQVTIIAMALSGSAAIATALSFGGPIWLTFVLIVIWGIFVIPDSAQFSALVADASPPDLAGSAMTLQTALGFALTAVTVQVTPLLASAFGWPAILAGLALGPAVGIAAMLRLLKG